MVGKLATLTKGAPWARYLLPQLYTSIAFALAQNKLTLEKSSSEFKRLAKTISSKNFSPSEKGNKEHQSIVRFALKKAAKMMHNSPAQYNTIVSMREELEISKNTLEPTSCVARKARKHPLLQHMEMLAWMLPEASVLNLNFGGI